MIQIEEDFWQLRDLNPQPSHLIYDKLDHRTTVSCSLNLLQTEIAVLKLLSNRSCCVSARKFLNLKKTDFIPHILQKSIVDSILVWPLGLKFPNVETSLLLVILNLIFIFLNIMDGFPSGVHLFDHLQWSIFRVLVFIAYQPCARAPTSTVVFKLEINLSPLPGFEPTTSVVPS